MAGVFTLVVQLASEGGTQVAVLDPVPPRRALSRSSRAVPPDAIVLSAYLQQLPAQVAFRPMALEGFDSPGFSLRSQAGVLAGIPQEATDGPVQFTVVVTDSIGTQASAVTLTLQIISPGLLTILTLFLQPAVVGVQYDQPILASDACNPRGHLQLELAFGDRSAG